LFFDWLVFMSFWKKSKSSDLIGLLQCKDGNLPTGTVPRMDMVWAHFFIHG
jgi:hypothetical protein